MFCALLLNPPIFDDKRREVWVELLGQICLGFHRTRIKVVPFVVKANTRGRSNMHIEDTERLVTEIEMIRLYCV
jgi:hypothetical protein